MLYVELRNVQVFKNWKMNENRTRQRSGKRQGETWQNVVSECDKVSCIVISSGAYTGRPVSTSIVWIHRGSVART